MFLSSSSRICFLIYVLCSINVISAEILQDANEWMCVDEKCSVPISLSTAKKKYVPDDRKKISVKVGDKVEILGKPVDPTGNYYYVKSAVSKRKGLLSKDFIRESQVFHSPQNLVKVNVSKATANKKNLDISPSAPTNVYEGTTIIESYEDAHYPYEPTQDQGPTNDAGSPSVVQSTTPPSVIGDDSPFSMNSSGIDASDGERKSEVSGSDLSTPSDVPISESKPVDQKSDLDGNVISSTPASSIINPASQSHDIHKDADVVSATTEIPVSSAQIDKSQTPKSMNSVEESSNSKVGNKTEDEDVRSEEAKEGEAVCENIATSVSSYMPFINYPKEPNTPKSVNQQNNSTESITTAPQTSLESADKPDEAKTESTHVTSEDATSVAQQVIPEQPVADHSTSRDSPDTADPEHKPSDLIVEQSSKDDKPSEIKDPNLQKNSSDPGVPLTSDSGPIIPPSKLIEEPADNKQANRVDSDNKSGPQSPTPHNDTSEEETKPVNKQIADIQPTDQSKTMVQSEGSSSETLPSNAGSTDYSEISQNNQVKSEQLPTQPAQSEVSDREVVDEISAGSEEDSNINFQSSMIEGNSTNDDSVESEVLSKNETVDSVTATVDPGRIEVPALPSLSIFSSNSDIVDPRVSDPAVPSSSPVSKIPVVTEVPKIEAEPTDIPPITHTHESVPHVDEAITTSPPPEPEIVDEAVTIHSEEYPEPPLVQEGSSDPWYSSIFSAFSMFSSHVAETEVIPSTADTPEVTPTFQEDEKSETCSTETCDGQPQISLGMEKEENNLAFEHVWLSPRGMLLMIITAVAVLLFSLGHYYLENLKREVELVSKYNDLAGKLFIEQKEKEMLTEQLASVNESMTQISFDTTKYDKEISDLKSLVQKYKEEQSSIEEKEKETRKKFMMVDKNYNELRNMLSQNKQKGERSALILDIKNLKESIAGNNIEIASLKEQLIEKKEEIKSLNARIMEFMDTKKELEKNVEKAISENHETAQKYQDNIAKLEKTIEESTAARVKLEKECTQLKKERESLAIEKELAESSLQKFQRLKPSTNALSEWLDAKEVRVSLLAAEKKVEELTMVRDDLIREKNLFEEKQSTLIFDFEQLNEKYEKAEKDKIEALTKLQVLSDYFKEKESQLQEELGTKESLWLQKQSDDRTIYEQMRALREENTSFKNQNETLKREILDQEASFKKLITSAEEKAHENWVALRHHERRLKEAQMEASQLRSRLTALEATGDNSDDKMNKGEVNGDIPSYGSATSPPFMLYPEFVPPPPLLTTTPSRPPPLGRISSPPLGDFTPPPPLVPYEMFLPPSPPPPAPHILHKPQPLDGSHRIQKDSQSSNHSNESAPDRPRRNKR